MPGYTKVQPAFRKEKSMYLYIVSHGNGEKELFQMELRHLFNIKHDKNYFISNLYMDVNRSPFVKGCIHIEIEASSLEEMLEKIKASGFSREDFKVKYVDIEGNGEFDEKHRIERMVGLEITGEAKIHEPEIIIGVTCIQGRWILGEYYRNERLWELHNNRPRQYSTSLPTRLARAIVNIAVGRDMDAKIVDPCCGIGTVVIEALSMGVNIRGYDINPKVVEGAKINLNYFEYRDVISEGDIRKINGGYDAAIIDIPYGLAARTTSDTQMDIIKGARRIANMMLLVSVEQMDMEIEEAGFKIMDKCLLYKGKFIRYITLCK